MKRAKDKQWRDDVNYKINRALKQHARDVVVEMLTTPAGLSDVIALLVEAHGIDRVQAALDQAAGTSDAQDGE